MHSFAYKFLSEIVNNDQIAHETGQLPYQLLSTHELYELLR